MLMGMKKRLGATLSGTHRMMSRALGALKGLKRLDAEHLQAFERALIEADLGQALTSELVLAVQNRFAQGVESETSVINFIKTYLKAIFPKSELAFADQTNVIFVLGVNGVGKTTTIGKLAHYYQQLEMQVGVAPGDTYRAAAYEQLQHWADLTNAVMFHEPGVKDPAAVMYDAVSKSQGKVDILLADTAGRMHGSQNLMDQLNKMKRVMGKVDEHAPHHTWLVLDGSLGQNSIEQAKSFHAAVGLTGLIITKIDGSAKGGAIFSIVKQLNIPIYFVGVGEQVEDLQPFDPDTFVDQVLAS